MIVSQKRSSYHYYRLKIVKVHRQGLVSHYYIQYTHIRLTCSYRDIKFEIIMKTMFSWYSSFIGCMVQCYPSPLYRLSIATVAIVVIETLFQFHFQITMASTEIAKAIVIWKWNWKKCFNYIL